MNQETIQPEGREQVEINSTSNFQKAIEQGLLAQAEEWLFAQEIGEDKKYDKRWRDHRERELFKAYCQNNDWTNAKRIVENSVMPDSKRGRIKRLKELSGKNYEEI